MRRSSATGAGAHTGLQKEAEAGAGTETDLGTDTDPDADPGESLLVVTHPELAEEVRCVVTGGVIAVQGDVVGPGSDECGALAIDP